ncbi:MAG TPA: cold shock domain-containing protein [Roseateles sp.]
MPFTGTLRTWQDDRGFGFIAPSHGGAEVFVHIRDLPRDGSRPTVGERLRYELSRGDDGRPRAVRVQRLAVGTPPPPRSRAYRPARLTGLWPRLLAVLLLAGMGAAGWKWYQGQAHRRDLEAQPAVARPLAPVEPATGLRCDGRTFCSQMTSCAEATWFINHCPGTKMDGNHDGVPCEQQWCTGTGSR